MTSRLEIENIEILSSGLVEGLRCDVGSVQEAIRNAEGPKLKAPESGGG